MTNYRSDYATGKRNAPQPDDGDIEITPLDILLPAAPVVGDTIELLQLPPGVQLVHYQIIAPQLDSNGTPTLDASLGYLNAGKTDLGTTLGSGLQIGRGANGNVVANADARAYAADASDARNVALKWTTAAATWAGAGKKILVKLHLKG